MGRKRNYVGSEGDNNDHAQQVIELTCEGME